MIENWFRYTCHLYSLALTQKFVCCHNILGSKQMALTTVVDRARVNITKGDGTSTGKV
jgi:hypothetical protein